MCEEKTTFALHADKQHISTTMCVNLLVVTMFEGSDYIEDISNWNISQFHMNPSGISYWQ